MALSRVEIHLCQLNELRSLIPNSCTEGNESFLENEPFFTRYGNTEISSLENSTHWNLSRKEK